MFLYADDFSRVEKTGVKIAEYLLKAIEEIGPSNVIQVVTDNVASCKLTGAEVSKDCGQPGFTLSERKRFGSILKEGKLIDAYRFLHKDKDMERGFSWSGHPIGKYRGKRMRIDYLLVSEKLKDRIVKCEMHGQGIELEGFYGSDHCPVSLELSEPSPDANHGEILKPE